MTTSLPTTSDVLSRLPAGSQRARVDEDGDTVVVSWRGSYPKTWCAWRFSRAASNELWLLGAAIGKPTRRAALSAVRAAR